MVNKSWIDEKIFWLTGILNVDDNLFFSNFNETFTLCNYFESSKTNDIQKAIDYISKKLGFIPPNVEYDWSGQKIDLTNNSNIKGLMSGGKIVLSLLDTGDKFLLASVSIHELMHYILMYRNNIIIKDNVENEKITDLAAIVLGFGKIILNGKIKEINKFQKQILGLLTLEETAYAFKKISTLRNTDDFSYLTKDALDILNLSFIDKIKIFYKSSKQYFLRDRFKKKNCPFCKREIFINAKYCNFCKRQLVEKL